MKKSLYIFLAVLLVLSCFSLVLAEETTIATTSTSSTTPTTDTGQAQSTTLINQQQVKDVSKEVVANLDQGVKDVFQDQINFPNYLQNPIKIIFGLESPIILRELILALGLWGLLFFIILDVLGFMPFMNEGIQKFFGAAIITTLSFLSGAPTKFALKFYDLIGFFELFQKYPSLKLIFAIFIVVLVLFITSSIGKSLKAKGKLEDSKKEGIKAGVGMAIASESLKQYSKSDKQ